MVPEGYLRGRNFPPPLHCDPSQQHDNVQLRQRSAAPPREPYNPPQYNPGQATSTTPTSSNTKPLGISPCPDMVVQPTPSLGAAGRGIHVIGSAKGFISRNRVLDNGLVAPRRTLSCHGCPVLTSGMLGGNLRY
eukprot:2648062-Rhodomonas_salina.2